MGKASRTKVDSSRREKIAAQRAAARRAEQRRRILIAGGSVLAVIIIIVGFIVFKANKTTTPTATSSSTLSGTALASVVSKTTTVPASALNSVGSGTVSVKPQTISGTALTSGGKPEMLYMGAEYCPYCAAERWSMIVALNRFGTFSGLSTVHSASVNGAGGTEPYPNTPTWTFHGSTYTSKYVTFTPVEMQTNIPDKSNGGYTNLETPTKDQQALLNKYDAPPYVPGSNGAIPFIDFGNKYLIAGASYNPQVLSGLSWAQIASDLKNPDSKVAKAIGGTANYITATICKMTGDQPASACTPAVQSLEASL